MLHYIYIIYISQCLFDGSVSRWRMTLLQQELTWKMHSLQ